MWYKQRNWCSFRHDNSIDCVMIMIEQKNLNKKNFEIKPKDGVTCR